MTTTLNAATVAGGKLVDTETIGGLELERVKLAIGGYGVDEGDVEASNPLPVEVASLPLPAGASTSAQIGEVQASPTANTVLDRLKTIATNLTGLVLGAGSALIGDVNMRMGGTAVDGNSGVKSNQTQRVVIATDQPALTAAWSTVAAGDVANDSADSGNPVKIGFKAIAVGAAPTAVTANDRVNAYATLHGQIFTLGGHPATLTLRANYAAVQTDTAIITQAAGGKIVVTRIAVKASNDLASSPFIIIGFGTANTPTTTKVVYSHPGFYAGLRDGDGNGGGILGIGADDEDLRITTGTITTGTVDVNVSYFILPA